MIHAENQTVKMEGTKEELLEELAEIVSSFIQSKNEFDMGEVFDAIEEGAKFGL